MSQYIKLQFISRAQWDRWDMGYDVVFGWLSSLTPTPWNEEENIQIIVCILERYKQRRPIHDHSPTLSDFHLIDVYCTCKNRHKGIEELSSFNMEFYCTRKVGDFFAIIFELYFQFIIRGTIWIQPKPNPFPPLCLTLSGYWGKPPCSQGSEKWPLMTNDNDPPSRLGWGSRGHGQYWILAAPLFTIIVTSQPHPPPPPVASFYKP